ncbi:MAG: adenylyl-sulfate kinase [Thermoproteota archaeon]|jgi:adenylylsulfate kinase|nr:adenylyl-sulfate kinase [Thermoproteota archaeon]
MKSFCIWLTGLPASGKSTIASLLKNALQNMGISVQILDSDELRKILTPKPTYSLEERDWFYSVLVYIAKLLVDNGVNVIIAATGNKKRYRDEARSQIKNFIEVYLKCDIETCMKRDKKGIYEAAKKGLASTVPGLQDPYEESNNAELVLETNKLNPNECVEQIIDYLISRELINSKKR